MSDGVRSRSYGFEVVVSARLVVEASDGRAARALVEGMLDDVSARLTSGVGADRHLDDVRIIPARLALATVDGADPTAALRAALDASEGQFTSVTVRPCLSGAVT